MEPENELTGQQSLSIIQQMIDTAKQEQKDNGKGWIIWGWMLFLASFSTVLNLRYEWADPYLFWNIFGGVTLLIGLFEVVQAVFIKRRNKVKTYTRDLYNKLNTGFFISLMFIIIAMNIGIHPRIGFPLLMNLYGFWVLIYGAVLNFKPSMIGAFIVWALAFACLFTKSFELIMILHGIAVMCGYIIPGHIAYNEFKKLHGRSTNQHLSV